MIWLSASQKVAVSSRLLSHGAPRGLNACDVGRFAARDCDGGSATTRPTALDKSARGSLPRSPAAIAA
jgi:hypothetical protein